MAGPRQPISLIEAKGKKHLTKKEIEERKATEVKGKTDNVKAPLYLPEDLKIEFDRIANELLRIDIMSNLDNEALARFVVSEFNYQKISTEVLKTSIDDEKYFNYLIMQEKAFKQSRQAATDLGLTISSRCKLIIPKTEEKKPENKFAKFI